MTCAGGIQTRNRTCEGQSNGGLACPGNDVGVKVCNDHECPSEL